MNIGPVQLLIVAIIILVLFGRGKISEMMGDFGKGIKSFKQGMNESDSPKAATPAQIEQKSEDAAPAAVEKETAPESETRG